MYLRTSPVFPVLKNTKDIKVHFITKCEFCGEPWRLRLVRVWNKFVDSVFYLKFHLER